MIFYSDSMMRNYINGLPESKTFYVASYGFKKDLYKIPKHAKLLIGLPYLPDCKPDCPDCHQRRVKNKVEIIAAISPYEHKLIDKIHLKLLVTDTLAIIGSRNLTGSQYEDLSIGIEDPNMIQALKEHFEYLWDKCRNLNDPAEGKLRFYSINLPEQNDNPDSSLKYKTGQPIYPTNTEFKIEFI